MGNYFVTTAGSTSDKKCNYLKKIFKQHCCLNFGRSRWRKKTQGIKCYHFLPINNKYNHYLLLVIRLESCVLKRTGVYAWCYVTLFPTGIKSLYGSVLFKNCSWFSQIFTYKRTSVLQIFFSLFVCFDFGTVSRAS